MEEHNQIDVDHSNHHGVNHIHNHQNMGHPSHDSHVMPTNSSYIQDIIGSLNSSKEPDYNSDMSSHRHGLHDGHHMSHEGDSMSMTFHGGFMETILFSWWNVTDVGEFIGSFLAVFLMALLYEGLKYYRKHLLWKTYTGLQYCAVAPPDKGVANLCAPDDPQTIQPIPHVLERNVPTMMSAAHAWQTVLHGVQVFVSYMLMLIFMTYNVWLCAAVVLGSATGYFLFGWRESVVVDFTEHCH